MFAQETGRRIVHHEVGKSKAAVQAARTPVVVLDLQREPAATAPNRLGLGSFEKRPTYAVSAQVWNNRQVMDIEQRTGLKGGKPKEAHGYPDGSLLKECQEHQCRG